MSDEPRPGTNDPLPDPPSEEDLDSKISEIRERAVAARAKYEQADPNARIDSDSARGIGIGMTAGYAIIGLPLIGAGAGFLLDRLFHTWFLIAIGAVAGLIMGIVYAVRLSNQN
ncbi:MAG TPA: hypothetical protein VNI20_03035 [Fimbriimonadaceae bacterium]|nr:hypothetical protein [Fimbriimonadaceae bacterium]